MLAPSLAMVRWLGLPASARVPMKRGAYALVIVAAVAALVGLYVVFGRPGALIPITFTAAIVTWRVRRQLTAFDALCAFALGAVASIAGLGAEWVGTDTAVWAVLQLPLTAFGLLAGWGILRGSDLAHTAASSALLVSEGPGAAARAALFGMVIAVPWALFNVAAGGSVRDTWVQAPWQTFAAAQPAIAEEAWARVFLVALLYVALRWAASPRVALAGAIVVAGYWFAWLHVHDLTIGALVNTIVAGTLFSLPLTFLWLRRGLEAAIGFHFAVDATRMAFAYFINAELV